MFNKAQMTEAIKFSHENQVPIYCLNKVAAMRIKLHAKKLKLKIP